MNAIKCLLLAVSLFAIYGANGQTAQHDALTNELTKHFEQSNLPGFAVALIDEDGLLYEKGFGYADKQKKSPYSAETVQNLGSVSKTLVGLALAKAIEENKLSLDTKINDILPFKVVNPYHKDIPILVRHLATHTSSILDTKHYGKSYIDIEGFDNGEGIHEDFLGFLKSHQKMPMKDFLFRVLNKKGKWYKKKNFLKSKPGTKKEYSNINAALAAYVIEVATATPFMEYTQEKIFKPLKMSSTTWAFDKTDPKKLATPYFPAGSVVPRYALITYPDGGLYSNAYDLSKYLQEIIKAYQGKSAFLPLQYAQMMLPGDEDENRAFWGMGTVSRNIGHSGSDPGAQTDLQFNADWKVGRIILCNVNAEDNDEQMKQYNQIHKIVAKYENSLKASRGR